MRFKTRHGYVTFMNTVPEEKYKEILQGYASKLKELGQDLQSIEKANRLSQRHKNDKKEEE